MPENNATSVDVHNFNLTIGRDLTLKDISFSLEAGEVISIIGGSGLGKSMLLRSLLGLVPHNSGTVKLLGYDINDLSYSQRHDLLSRIGVLFQFGALFSSQTVLENIMTPMQELASIPPATRERLARMKLDMVGLSQKNANKFPAELSGGMMKRVGIARALALDPELIFLDEPCSGLDPIASTEIDDLIMYLQKYLKLSVVSVTHSVGSLERFGGRVLVLGDGQIIADDNLEAVKRSVHPWINSYFSSINALDSIHFSEKHERF